MPSSSRSDPEQPADLYGLDPEEFTAERNALAKRLRSGGDRETAARVAKLRRPPVSAWALNQLARNRPDQIEALLEAAAALAAAFIDPAAGDARAAQTEFRHRMSEATSAAIAVITSTGRNLTTAVQMDVQATLQAAAADDRVAAALRSGTLADDHGAPGFMVGADESDPDGSSPKVRRNAGTAKESSKRRPKLTVVRSGADAEEVARAAAGERVERADRQRASARASARHLQQVTKLRMHRDRLLQRAERLNADAVDARVRAEEAVVRAEERRDAADEAFAEADAAVEELAKLEAQPPNAL